jgi:hypothetical protein
MKGLKLSDYDAKVRCHPLQLAFPALSIKERSVILNCRTLTEV